MSDEITNLLSEIAPDLKDAPAPSDTKGNEAETETEVEETEGDEGGDDDLDYDNATPEQQKEWPKPFKNALSRAKKERTKALAEKKQLEDQIAELRRAQQQQPPQKKEETTTEKPGEEKVSTEMKAILDKKPKLEDFKDWGSYNEALVNWKASVTKQELKEEGTVERQKQKADEEKQLAISKNRERIVTQAKELIQEFPGYMDLLKANAGHLENFPEHVAEAFRESENPAIAFVVLAENKGALEALSKMSPIKAAQYIGQAEYIGMEQLRAFRAAKANGNASGAEGAETTGKEGKRVSSAPAPMRTAKGGTTGGKALENMTADELAKSKELADVFK